MARTLGKILKELRKRKGRLYTQEKFAVELSKLSKKTISKSTIACWELGTSSPDIHMIKIIAQYHNVSVDYLLGLETDPMTQEAFNPAIKQMKEIIRDMNGNSKEFLETVSRNYFETIQKRDKEVNTLTFKAPVDY